MRNINRVILFWLALAAMTAGGEVGGQAAGGPAFNEGEIEQLVAPIALYPDSLVSQILMASTYPLEVVQAQRWAEQNKGLSGDALASALNEQTWDPSVKSLVNFPDVLTMMNEKLDWTQKLGDAFLAQQKDVMDGIQTLRKKAEDAGNLKTTEQQIVKTEQQTIIIESANPQVIYVPTYDPVVVYGTWPYPAYPPYYYYPPGYRAGSNLLSFGLGFACGAAWGWAWGGCNWGRGDVDININQNTNFNRNIDRSKYKAEFQGRDRGQWQHNAEHRKGVAYRDNKTAGRYNRASTNEAIKSREAFRGRAEQGRQELARGGVEGPRAAQQPAQRPATRPGDGGRPRETPARPGGGGTREVSRAKPSDRGAAFQGMDKSGKSARQSSNRGSASRQSMSRPSGGAPRGGGGRGGGGGGSGGGGRR
jgi:hypothetical protein